MSTIKSFPRAVLRRPEWWLLMASALATGGHICLNPPERWELLPAAVYDFFLRMNFESPDRELQVRTFLPTDDERQFVMDEALQADRLVFSEEETRAGRIGRWSAGPSEEVREASYQARISLSGMRFDIPGDLALPSDWPMDFDPELRETPAIQISAPEIQSLWQELDPDKPTVLATLRAIYDFTANEIEGAEFKGYTDALTALRLRQASCNGKSRLFVALARLNRLPARLVGGVILNSGRKKTSHQWVEVHIQDQWVPFDPTNRHFASIPGNYLVLYRGDEALFSHSPNINFDYLFSISTTRTVGFEAVSPVNGRQPSAWLPALLKNAGLEASLLGVLLLFPLTALLISIARNVVGISTFGVFMPMLVGAACRYTGLGVGLLAVAGVIALAILLRLPMRRLNLLQIPRISALVTIVTMLIVTVIALSYRQIGTGIGMLVLFPVIVLSFTAERISGALEQEAPAEVVKNAVSTTAMVILCYLIFSSRLLESVVLIFPEVLLGVLGLQIAVGRWTGIRVTEFIRFHRLIHSLRREQTAQASEMLLGINARNRELVQKLNPPELIATANDKILSKTLLAGAGVRVPKTLAIVQDVWDLQAVRRQLPHWFNFVVKPARGAKGQGIVVVHGRQGENFCLAGNRTLTLEQLMAHMRTIIAGEFSVSGYRDEVLIESLIHPTAFYQELAPGGLCDIRVMLVNGELLAAMLRVPTAKSDGKANLHRGGIGLPIDLKTGITGPGYREGRQLSTGESGIEFSGRQIPQWDRIVELSRASQRAIPLGFVGVDIAEDAAEGPVVLEVNARPGLEIQNVHGKGFASRVEKLTEPATNDGPLEFGL